VFFEPRQVALSDEMRTAVQGVLFCATALACLGVVMIFSVCAGQGAAGGASVGEAVVRRLGSLAVGVAGLCVFSRVNLRWLQEQRFWLLGTACLLLLVVLIPGIGTLRNGARRWLRVGALGVQPSEIAKLCLLVYVAGYAREHGRRLHTVGAGLALPGLIVAGVCGLVFLEPDYGTALLMALVSVSVLVVAGSRVWHVAGVGACLLPVLGYAVWRSPARWRRIVAFLSPDEHGAGAAYQMRQAVMALGSGGPWGVGPGAGEQKYFFLPQSGSDFIFAMIGEELGFVGAAAVLALFGALVWFGMRIALRARDPFDSLLACGLTLYIGLQAVIHVAVVSGSMPTTGMTLPFVSRGGSSLVVCLVGIGLLMAVARRASATPARVSLAAGRCSPVPPAKAASRR